MIALDLPEVSKAPHVVTIKESQQNRAEEILNALILQTAQVEYDEVAVTKLVNEYETLVARSFSRQ